MTPSQLASRLGRLARGKKKKLSREEIARRTRQLIKAARKYRASLKKKKTRQ